ncbi:VCBS repeat-containing protein [Streptomyces sp. NPDC005962]|uniref:FG-GAP repeat domain-containing protein n=1 Tax=Streptomyces sp. NPDC005962 TaxID=3154466 RepID=UPI0033E72297
MASRSTSHVLTVGAVCLVLVPLTGCGPDGGGPSSSKGTSAGQPSAPTESRAPSRGKGSKDPDDLNGDGHRDLVLPAPARRDPEKTGRDERVGVVYGSAKGLDPATRTVHGRGDLGLPAVGDTTPGAGPDHVPTDGVVTADLDGDGFSDVVTTVEGEMADDGNISAARSVPHVTWGGPGGPEKGAGATPVKLPEGASKLGVTSVVRGDFDGDGHHDVAGLAQNQSSAVVLYGPFTRSGEPKRTDTSLPFTDGELAADAIDPSGKPRATSLLAHAVSDGEQSGNTLYPARRGTGLSAEGRKLRAGNAQAFGDFDGDGKRDVAIGDDGSRNDEPGNETEPSDVSGSLTVYPGSGGAPVDQRSPVAAEDPEGYEGAGGYTAADPDGDGRDGILVATYAGATFVDGDRRTPVSRKGPAKADGRKVRAKDRAARPVGAADYDGDGKDELVLNWGSGDSTGPYGQQPTHWWITDGTGSRDKTSFATTEFAKD